MGDVIPHWMEQQGENEHFSFQAFDAAKKNYRGFRFVGLRKKIYATGTFFA